MNAAQLKVRVRDVQPGQLYRCTGAWRKVTRSFAHGSAWILDTDQANGYGGTGYVYGDPDELVEVNTNHETS